ncbi:MAG: hypothetical protein JWO19_4941 [Bryobacterales bacterium]|nr:hypothetical protein [Bryobacterales bacterium]
MAVSLLCAIHCVVLPLALGSLAAAGLSWLHNEALEWIILAGSLIIGVCGLLPAYRTRHRKKRCLWLFLFGVLSILVGRLAGQSLQETPFIVAGAALIVSAHGTNQYLCSRCPRCDDTCAE